MSKTTGFSRYTCDRCGKSLYAADNAPDVQNWAEIKRISVDGGEQSRLLCERCKAAYRDLASRHDTEFGRLMADGKAVE